MKEATDIFQRYYERYGKIPDKSIFHEYFYLFSLPDHLTDLYKEKMKENGNYSECISYMNSHKPLFDNYELFCEYAMHSSTVR